MGLAIHSLADFTPGFAAIGWLRRTYAAMVLPRYTFRNSKRRSLSISSL
jgi:hypothetical protein